VLELEVQIAIELSLSVVSVSPIWHTDATGPKNLEVSGNTRLVDLIAWLQLFNQLHVKFNEENINEDVDDQDGGLLWVKKVDPENGLDQIRIYYQSTLLTSVQSFQSAANTFTISCFISDLPVHRDLASSNLSPSMTSSGNSDIATNIPRYAIVCSISLLVYPLRSHKRGNFRSQSIFNMVMPLFCTTS
jgi:hypothetical protein